MGMMLQGIGAIAKVEGGQRKRVNQIELASLVSINSQYERKMFVSIIYNLQMRACTVS